jgi:hypothetical protein
MSKITYQSDWDKLTNEKKTQIRAEMAEVEKGVKVYDNPSVSGVGKSYIIVNKDGDRLCSGVELEMPVYISEIIQGVLQHAGLGKS